MLTYYALATESMARPETLARRLAAISPKQTRSLDLFDPIDFHIPVAAPIAMDFVGPTKLMRLK
jgi:hypothetical protein